VVEDREKAITTAIESAKRERAEAERLLAEQKNAISEARREAAEMIKKNQAEVERVRDEIRSLPFDEGLLLLIKDAAPRLREIETWVDIDDPDVASFRLEDVNADPREWVVQILKHCGVTLSPDELETVLGDVSRDALQARDLAQREAGAESHYRVDRKTFRDVFKPEHYEALEEIVPGLAQRLGYPD
jgi:hypothetical protein